MTDDRITRMRQIVARQDELAEEAARLKAEMRELLELQTPRKSSKHSVLPHAEGLFAGAARRRSREHISTQ